MAGPTELVLDTSVWINLLATEQPWAILDALNVRSVAPEQVFHEIKRNPVTKQPYSMDRHPLLRRHSVEVVRLDREELDIFLTLVSQDSVDALGDGEAAAIAVAKVRGCRLALDDRKARRIVRANYPEIRVLMTVDMLRHPEVRARLGDAACETAFSMAKQFGRMHVPKNFPS